MDFEHSFTVRASIDQVWDLMLNVEAVTPCIPGAEINETIDDSHYKGSLRVKVGPVSMSYKGELEVERDRAAATIRLRAKGAEVKGIGRASAQILARLQPDNVGTSVRLESHVELSGRVAQFGRGIVQDVANRNINRFAECLEEKLRSN